MDNAESLIPGHGGYRHLKSFQVAQLVYDVTVRFCNRYIPRASRTHDQMVQAARSGVQNIAEGSQASGTSKKMELKLTNVARASLEELKLDYEDFLRQRAWALWERRDPRRQDLIDRRPRTADEVAVWVKGICRGGQDGRGGQGGRSGRSGQGERCGQDERCGDIQKSTASTPSSSSTVPTPPHNSTYEETSANAALVLIAVACGLLDRQIKAQAEAFKKEGGFTERLYNIRQANKKRQ
ncbi:four helix bundle protein [Candidatus Sumerlaeota bacterium]|nr:four helix bundle protein [Candidatus Sumerlaeota bacterium]